MGKPYKYSDTLTLANGAQQLNIPSVGGQYSRQSFTMMFMNLGTFDATITITDPYGQTDDKNIPVKASGGVFIETKCPWEKVAGVFTVTVSGGAITMFVSVYSDGDAIKDTLGPSDVGPTGQGILGKAILADQSVVVPT